MKIYQVAKTADNGWSGVWDISTIDDGWYWTYGRNILSIAEILWYFYIALLEKKSPDTKKCID